LGVAVRNHLAKLDAQGAQLNLDSRDSLVHGLANFFGAFERDEAAREHLRRRVLAVVIDLAKLALESIEPRHDHAAAVNELRPLILPFVMQLLDQAAEGFELVHGRELVHAVKNLAERSARNDEVG